MIEGRIIQERYRLESMLGRGGMGSVWRATHLELGTPVAVKLIDQDAADSKQALARFKREAQSAASLRGTNVVQILDYGVDEGVAYIVMELLEGESLGARLARKAPLSPLETAWILGQVGKALVKAHALNIVHRDLKPDNIFIVRDGDEEVAKVLDFGIAKMLSKTAFEASIQTRSGAILGTPHYMSPEQASGRAAVDHRADIWSLGVIGFECLTASRPFRGNTLGGLVMSICSDPIPMPSHCGPVPRGLDEWFLRCVSRNPADRFQSVAEVMAALRSVCCPSQAPSAREPSLAPVGHEMTLRHSSRAPSVPAPMAFAPTQFADSNPGQSLAATNPPETVSAASRTLGNTPQRRTLWVPVATGLLLFGAGGVTFWGLHDMAVPAIASSAPQPSASVDAGPSSPIPLPSLALVKPTPPEATNASPSAADSSAPPIVLEVHVESSSPGAAARNIGGKAQAPNAVGAGPVASAPTGAPAKLGDSAAQKDVQAKDAPTKDAQGAEPTSRPESEPADNPNPARRRNVEDRLAF